MTNRTTVTRALLFAAAATTFACGAAALTITGPPQPARDDRCDFRILTAAPASGFVELGTIDVDSTNQTNLLGVLKDTIQPYVCKAGGDAAIALANGAGVYVKATVVKLAPSSSPTQAAPPVPAGGCQFDTHCKGDRICVRGECVDPARK